MCHHTREPTVLSRVSCRSFHLNFDRFHQPCLLPGRTSRIGEDCRPRTTWRPLTLFGQPGSSSFAAHWRYCHADLTVPRQDVNSSFPNACATSHQGVCTHAGSGPSRVRRRLFGTCLGDPVFLRGFPMRPSFPAPQCLQPLCHRSKFPPRTERIQGIIQVRLSFQNDGFLSWSFAEIG